MKEIEMEEKKEREGKEAEGDRKEKIERGKRRKIKKMRQLSLGCRARKKPWSTSGLPGLYSPYLSWAFQPSKFFLKLLLVATVPRVFTSTHQDHCVACLGISLFFPWFSSLTINYHSSSQRQLVTFLPVASCLCSDMISEDVSSHPLTCHSKATFWFCCWVCALVLSPWVFCLFPMAHTLYVPDLWWWSIPNLLGPGTKLLAGIILMRLHSFRTTQGHVSFESIKFAKQIPDCLHLYTSSDIHGCLKLCSHLHCPFVSQWWCEDSDVT